MANNYRVTWLAPATDDDRPEGSPAESHYRVIFGAQTPVDVPVGQPLQAEFMNIIEHGEYPSRVELYDFDNQLIVGLDGPVTTVGPNGGALHKPSSIAVVEF